MLYEKYHFIGLLSNIIDNVHQILFQLLEDLQDADEPIDPLIITDWLNRDVGIEKIGGIETETARTVFRLYVR